MPNELRRKFDSVANNARIAGLPKIELQPHRFPDRWEILVGEWNFVGRDVEEALKMADLWIAGYSARMCAEQDAYDAANEELTGRECCKKIIEGSGLGGPTDHVLLAKALLGLGDDLILGDRDGDV